MNTDDADPLVVLAEVGICAGSWEPNVRLLGNVRAGDIVRAVNAILTAAPASATEPVKVKPLAWRVFCGNSGSVEAEAFGDQYVIQNEAEIWCLYRPYQDTPASHHGALHDAKAAAQADFEARIRSALYAGPEVTS